MTHVCCDFNPGGSSRTGLAFVCGGCHGSLRRQFLPLFVHDERSFPGNHRRRAARTCYVRVHVHAQRDLFPAPLLSTSQYPPEGAPDLGSPGILVTVGRVTARFGLRTSSTTPAACLQTGVTRLPGSKPSVLILRIQPITTSRGLTGSERAPDVWMWVSTYIHLRSSKVG